MFVLSYRGQPAPSRGNSPVGATHFSLSLLPARLASALSPLCDQVLTINRPEIYSNEISRQFLRSPGKVLVHLAFGDYASLRVLKYAYNIAHVSWEYEKISTAVNAQTSIWKNQLWVLNLFDEIWVGTEFTKNVLTGYGLKNVQVIPVPVPDPLTPPPAHISEVIGDLPCVPLMFDFTGGQSVTCRVLRESMTQFREFIALTFLSRDTPKIYLTIINPGDHRKNVEATILGFVRFAAENPQSLLIVKLVDAEERSLSEILWETLRLRLERLIRGGIVRSESVVFVGGFLPERKLMQLIQASDFYVSTSLAEGQNLPVMEAMSLGTVVISPIHTAMACYLSEHNCIPCNYTPIITDGLAATSYPIAPVTQNVVSINDVAMALSASVVMSDAEMGRIRENALLAIKGTYDTAGVQARLRARVNEIVGFKGSASTAFAPSAEAIRRTS